LFIDLALLKTIVFALLLGKSTEFKTRSHVDSSERIKKQSKKEINKDIPTKKVIKNPLSKKEKLFTCINLIDRKHHPNI